MAKNPYADLPPSAFWKKAVAERHIADLENIWRPVELSATDKVATAGSCFAQHIGRHLRRGGADYIDLEPAPAFLPPEKHADFGYGLYSCRYGNIYSSRQLLQLAEEAFGLRQPEFTWTKGERFFDALRPSVDPVGHASEEAVRKQRRSHLAAVRQMLETLDVFVFTLGLTEGWVGADQTMYPTAPGTIAGTFDADEYRFVNLRYHDVLDDLTRFRELLHGVNAGARMVLTVSPVPLVATASGDHVLAATVRSKSTLRAAAGDFAEDHEDVSYFPSFEIISSHPSRGCFFNPDLRTVNDFGVRYVMSHFFGASGAYEEPLEVVCEEDRVNAMVS